MKILVICRQLNYEEKNASKVGGGSRRQTNQNSYTSFNHQKPENTVYLDGLSNVSTVAES